MPIFNLLVPRVLDGLAPDILDPRNSWRNSQLWEEKAKELAKLFIENFEQFCDNNLGKSLSRFGPVL